MIRVLLNGLMEYVSAYYNALHNNALAGSWTKKRLPHQQRLCICFLDFCWMEK